MPANNQKVNSLWRNFINHLYQISLIIIVIILAILMFFLYNNVYKTLSHAEAVTELEKEVTEEELAREKFKEIMSQMETKKLKSEVNIGFIRDPFEQIADLNADL